MSTTQKQNRLKIHESPCVVNIYTFKIPILSYKRGIIMKLKDVRKLGIKHCEDNNLNFAYISHDNVSEFYLTDKETKYTVFLVSKNGSLDAYMSTKYAEDFHKELKKRKNNRRNSHKRKMAEVCNYEESDDTE